jgi:hypothetical protein
MYRLKVNDENSRIRIRIRNPYPLIRGMNPRIQIHTKMSWIRKTGRWGVSGDLSAKLGDEHLGDGAVVGREHTVQDTEHALLSSAPHVTRPS